jgi:dihydrofolate synthase / folylpolyglutamate synthase
LRALEWLFNRQRFGMKPGLERMQQLLALADAAALPFEVVLVAGTNGKGSTASMLAAILSTS